MPVTPSAPTEKLFSSTSLSPFSCSDPRSMACPEQLCQLFTTTTAHDLYKQLTDKSNAYPEVSLCLVRCLDLEEDVPLLGPHHDALAPCHARTMMIRQPRRSPSILETKAQLSSPLPLMSLMSAACISLPLAVESSVGLQIIAGCSLERTYRKMDCELSAKPPKVKERLLKVAPAHETGNSKVEYVEA